MVAPSTGYTVSEPKDDVAQYVFNELIELQPRTIERLRKHGVDDVTIKNVVKIALRRAQILRLVKDRRKKMTKSPIRRLKSIRRNFKFFLGNNIYILPKEYLHLGLSFIDSWLEYDESLRRALQSSPSIYPSSEYAVRGHRNLNHALLLDIGEAVRHLTGARHPTFVFALVDTPFFKSFYPVKTSVSAIKTLFKRTDLPNFAKRNRIAAK